jgi:hypothetical protein
MVRLRFAHERLNLERERQHMKEEADRVRTQENDMDSKLLELLVELVPSLSDAVVSVVNDDLAALLLEKVERLLLQAGLDLFAEGFGFGRLGAW